MRCVAIIAYDSVNPFELGVATEIFGLDHSELGVEWYKTFVCAVEARPIQTRMGFRISSEYDLSHLTEADTIIVPSSHPGDAPIPPQLLVALQAAYKRGTRLVSFCTGAFILAAAGLLDGRLVATHWRWSQKLAHDYPGVRVDSQVLYIDDGQILTSAGTAASIDLALHIVTNDYGAEIAAGVARRMVVSPVREGGQAQYFDPVALEVTENGSFGLVLEWMQVHLTEDLAVGRLAVQFSMSERTFARRFRDATGTTPHHWVLQQRTRLAQRLLETSDKSIEQIAALCGFPSASVFRLHFQRIVQVAPQTYRRNFSQKRMLVNGLS